MKTFALAALLTLSAAFAAPVAMAAIEEPAFQTEREDGDFSVRRYAPMIVAETTVEGGLWGASNDGFRVIAGYIFGNNTAAGGERAKIAMTAPVTMEPERIAMTAPVTTEAAEGRYRMHFVMPSRYTLETLPRPNDPRVALREVPPQRMAAVRFTGFTGEGRVAEKTAELLAWMKGAGLEAAGAPQLARYDPPWTLPFLRRNEILVPLR